MLHEIKDVQQIRGEPFRRWFADDRFDLIVWFVKDGEIGGFQLCYDKNCKERALTWHKDSGFTHRAVDDGEAVGGHHKMTPILVPDGAFDSERVLKAFQRAGKGVDAATMTFVVQTIQTQAREPR